MTKTMLKRCPDTRECGAALMHGGVRFCKALNEVYKHDGDCPFCKPEMLYTNGKYYPINPEMGEVKAEKGEKCLQRMN